VAKRRRGRIFTVGGVVGKKVRKLQYGLRNKNHSSSGNKGGTRPQSNYSPLEETRKGMNQRSSIVKRRHCTTKGTDQELHRKKKRVDASSGFKADEQLHRLIGTELLESEKNFTDVRGQMLVRARAGGKNRSFHPKKSPRRTGATQRSKSRPKSHSKKQGGGWAYNKIGSKKGVNESADGREEKKLRHAVLERD